MELRSAVERCRGDVGLESIKVRDELVVGLHDVHPVRSTGDRCFNCRCSKGYVTIGRDTRIL